MSTAQHWIDRLRLEPHPEGGYYRQTYRAPLILPQAALPGFSGDRAASTAIYFLLTGDQFSAFHRLRSDEVMALPRRLYPHRARPSKPVGNTSELLLGSDPTSGEDFQAVVPAGCWFGSSLRQPGTWALVGCTVAPGFDFADFEMARRAELTVQFPQHRSNIIRCS